MTLKVAVIGTNFGAKVHVPAWRMHPDCEVVCICGRDVGKTQKIANDLQIPYYASTVDELLNNEKMLKDISIVSFAIPPEDQFDLLFKFALKGKNLFLEKPLCTIHIDDSFLNAFSNFLNLTGIHTAINFCYPSLEVFEEIKNRISSYIEKYPDDTVFIYDEWTVTTDKDLKLSHLPHVYNYFNYWLTRYIAGQSVFDGKVLYTNFDSDIYKGKGISKIVKGNRKSHKIEVRFTKPVYNFIAETTDGVEKFTINGKPIEGVDPSVDGRIIATSRTMQNLIDIIKGNTSMFYGNSALDGMFNQICIQISFKD